MARLEVEITGNVDSLGKSLKKAEKDLNKFDKDVSKSGKRIDRSLKNASKSVGGLQKNVANANPTLTEFSRVIQDAPFGIQGVANNITQLTSNFGHLTRSAGGSKEAFKLLLGSLTGPAGILLAVSTVTSLLVSFGDKLFKTKDATAKLKEEQDKLNKSLQNYIDGLESVSRSNLIANQSAQKELVTLRLLKTQLDDTSLSTKKRLGAVDELRKKYPDYLKNISDEKLLSEGLIGVYNKLTTSILNRAKATAATNKIVENSEKLLVLESQLAAKNEEIKQASINKELALNRATSASVKSRGAANIEVKKATKFTKELNKAQKDSISIQGQIQALELENIDLEQSIVENISKSGGGLATGRVSSTFTRQLEPVFKNIEDLYNKRLATTNEILKESSLNIEPKVDLTPATTQLDEGYANMLVKINEFNNQASQIINSGLSNAFASLGNSISSSLGNANTVFGAFANSIIQTGVKLLSALAAQAIKQVAISKTVSTAAAVESATKTAAKTPFGAFALPALIAGAVAAVGAAFSSIGGGGGGGVSTGGVSGGGSASTGQVSSTTSFSSSFGGQTVVFEIQGQKLVGVLSNTLRRNRSLGVDLGLGG